MIEYDEKVRSAEFFDDFGEDENFDSVKRRCLLELLDRDLRSPMGATLWQVQQSLVGPKMSDKMIALAITSLLADEYVERLTYTDHDGDPYSVVKLSDYGRKRIMREYAALMKDERERLQSRHQRGFGEGAELPF